MKSYKDEELLGVRDLMDLLNLGKPKVMEILHQPDCPVMKRVKQHSPWLVPYGAFIRWFNQVYMRR